MFKNFPSVEQVNRLSKRRTLVKFISTLIANPFVMAKAHSTSNKNYRMPAEWETHERCWMSWPRKASIWGHDLKKVKLVHARIASTIAEFEPVSLLTHKHNVTEVTEMCSNKVDIVEMPQDDNWARDTCPIFISNGQALKALSLNFNIWGSKFSEHSYANDMKLAKQLAAHLSLEFIPAGLIAEGGAIEVDGQGTLITTESCLLNPNRNPDKTKIQIENALYNAMALNKVIWLPGNDVEYITDGHIDGMVRFVAPGVVTAEITEDKNDPEFDSLNENIHILRRARDAHGKKLEIIPIFRPIDLDWDSLGDDFAASYSNFYIANQGVVMPKFGDKYFDNQAANTMRNLFPARQLKQIDITYLAKGGGGIHCSTQQQPAIN